MDLLKGALTAAQLKEFNIVVFVNAPRAKLEELGKVGVWWLGSGSVGVAQCVADAIVACCS